MNYYLGFDVGASSVKAVLAADGRVVQSVTADTPRVLAGLVELLADMKNILCGGVKHKIKGVGIALAGVLDKERRKMLVSPNIGYLDGKPLKKIFSQRLGLSVVLEHDVHCFLLAERRFGVARHLKNVFYITVGSGIGGAYMTEGKIAVGEHGAAGEAGHMVMYRDQKMPDWEYLASGKFLRRAGGIGLGEALRRAKSGDKRARRLLAEQGFNLGVGIANLINIFDPAAVIIGGGAAAARPIFSPEIKKVVGKLVISPEARRTKIIFSRLGRFGGAQGAALVVAGKKF